MNKYILVTGGLGFIGSHTIIELQKLDQFKIISIDNNSNSDISIKNKIECISGETFINYNADISDNNVLEEIFTKYNIYCVIHFASYKAVNESLKKPLLYYDNNVCGTINLLKVMNMYSCKKIIFSSSATVYGDQVYPVSENCETGRNLTNPYGKTKYILETILEDLSKADKDMCVIALRYFNPVGAHPSGIIGEDPLGIPNNLFPHILNAINGKQLSIFGADNLTPDGTCVRDFIHVADLARGHVSALSKLSEPGFHTYNLGTGRGTSVLELINIFERVNNLKINYVFVEKRIGDLEYVYANVDKASGELGWKTEKTNDDICKDGYNYYINKTQ